MFKKAYKPHYYQGIKLLRAPFLNNIPLEHGKILIITPRACGKSHERNLIKRQIRAIFYEENLHKTPALWIALVSKKAMAIPFENLKKALVATITTDFREGA